MFCLLMPKNLYICYFIGPGKNFIDHSLYIGHSILDHVDTCKFLGTFVDQHLTFKLHIQYLTNKVSEKEKYQNHLSYPTLHNFIHSYNVILLIYISIVIVIWSGLLIILLTYFPCLNFRKDIYVLLYIYCITLILTLSLKNSIS